MSLSARRGHTAAAKAAAERRRNARSAGTSPQPCQMKGCRRTTTLPLGYCAKCWKS